MRYLLLLLLSISAYSAEFKHKVFNFIQFTAEQGEGVTGDPDRDKPVFGFDRIWLGYKMNKGNVSALAIAGINKNSDTTNSKLRSAPDSLIRAFIKYDIAEQHQIKTGLEWSQMTLGNKTLGWALDVPKRTMETALTFHQQVGVTYKYLSDNKLIPTIEVGAYEPPARSGAVTKGNAGEQMAYAIAADWKFGENLFSLFSGKAEDAGANGGADYLVSGASFRHHIGSKFNLQLEIIKGEGILGVENREQTVSWVQIAYNHNDSNQAVIKYLSGKSTNTTDTTLNNLYVGWNFFLKPDLDDNRMKSRIQVFLVKASGDTSDSDTPWNGLSGYTADAVLTQFQLRFN